MPIFINTATYLNKIVRLSIFIYVNSNKSERKFNKSVKMYFMGSKH